MAKNSPSGNRERVAQHRKTLAERGIRPLQVMAPEAAHPLIRQAVKLMSRKDDPMDPRAAFRQVGGSNEPENGQEVATTAAELARVNEKFKAREQALQDAQAAQERLKAERDAARAAVAAEREKAEATAAEVQAAAIAAQEAQGRATEALDRAEKAEAVIQQARSLPGVRGRLVRWLAGDVLE